VTGVERAPRGYCVKTDNGAIEAANVVIATGAFQRPRLPAAGADLPPRLTQLHSSQYRNPGKLPPGAVLVVGSAQSGCQIAEELYQNGRKVYLCVGASSGRIPRRYRAKDCAWWLNQIGYYDRPVDASVARFTANPHLSGARGGHTLNLHQFARDGVSLLGHLRGVHDDQLALAPNLHASLRKIDQFEADLIAQFDDYARRTGLDLPPETLPALRDGYETEAITELDLDAAGIAGVIWATGYTCDFSWLNLPGLLDGDGAPIQTRGVTEIAGLYFLGLHCMHTVKSGLLFGVGDDAAHVAGHIQARRPTC
jgi:putative flavoprotein involved in K+ transport